MVNSPLWLARFRTLVSLHGLAAAAQALSRPTQGRRDGHPASGLFASPFPTTATCLRVAKGVAMLKAYNTAFVLCKGVVLQGFRHAGISSPPTLSPSVPWDRNQDRLAEASFLAGSATQDLENEDLLRPRRTDCSSPLKGRGIEL